MSSESKSVHSETTESVVDSGIYSLQSSEIPSNFSNCDICPETKILKFCDTCQASFCEKHVKSHYTDPVLRNHLLKDVDMLSEDELPPPVGIKLQSVMSDSVFLTWSPPECLTGPQQFRVTWECEGNQQSLSVTDGCELEINKLQPGQNYKFSVETEGVDGKKSRPVSTSVFTVATPKDLKTVNLTDNSFTLSWSEAQGMNNNPYGYFISYTCPGSNRASVHTPDCQKTFSGLKPGTEYNVSVSTVLNDGKQSEPVSMTICTEIPAPDKVNVDSVDTRAATVSWNQPHGTGGTQCKYQVSYCLRGTKPHIRNTSSTSIKLSELQPASEYYFSVCTVLENEKKSQPVSTTINTKLDTEIQIVLVGKVGVGKSAAANYILGKDLFETNDRPERQSSDIIYAKGLVDGQKIFVVETPGVFNHKKVEEILGEIKQCFAFCKPGPHVFLIVIPLGRFTHEEKETVNTLQKIFSGKAAEYTMVFFTFLNLLGGVSIEEYLKKDLYLQKIIQNCHGGYHVLDPNNPSQATELVKKIRDLIMRNGQSYYNQQMLKEAVKEMNKDKKCGMQ